MMFGLKINQAKTLFFDRAAVLSRVDKTTARVLATFGSYVRRTAKLSIRKRKKASEPGKPPNTHTRLLPQFIYFSFEPSRRSVVIGPALISRPTGAPEILEYGGTVTVEFNKRKKLFRDIRPGRRRRVLGWKKVKAKIEARPYMGPAYAKEEPKLPGMWRDAIK